MAIKQFIKIHWADDRKPYFKLYDKAQNKIEFIEATGSVQMKRLNTKSCVGYYNLQEMKEYPCENRINLTDSKYIRCKRCEDLTGFSLCMMCKGDVCRTTNSNALEFCKRKHMLYLAFFPNDIVKVGTAEYDRRYERLLEQGAVYSFFIAETNGMDIRKIETAVSKLGITSQVTPSQKLKNLLGYTSSQAVKELLVERLSFVRKKIDSFYLEYFIEPEFNDFGHLLSKLSVIPKSQPQYDLFGNIVNSNTNESYKIIQNINDLPGEVISIIGNIALLKDKTEFIALNLKGFYGWHIDFKNDKIL